MALNFGSQLFKGDVEDQVKSRWQQSGSSLVNVNAGDSGTFTAYTVTAGRTLFIDAIIITYNASTDVDVKDNSSTLLSVTGAADAVQTFYFSSPLRFTHSVVLTVASGSVIISATGWEE